MQYMIIKSNVNSFETTINDWLITEGCSVIHIEDLEEGKDGVQKRIILFRNIKKLIAKHEADKIIVFESLLIFLIICLFSNNCYLWLWNTFKVTKINRLRLLFAKLTKRVYSFDEEDCEKFKLKYNTQFFKLCNNIPCGCYNNIYFVGADKGRYMLLNSIYQYCINNNLKVKIQMLPEKNCDYENKSIVSSSYIEYSKVLDYVKHSEAILDICQQGQKGMTFRAVEAIFFNKKIITNNSFYKKMFFYSPSNIYVIEDEMFTGLDEFLNGSAIEYDDYTRNYFCIKNWLKRFK